MKKRKYTSFIYFILLFFIFSCSNKIDINDYSEKLKINFPSDMDLIFFDSQSEFQDYNITHIYKLSFNQKNALLDEIIREPSHQKEDFKNNLNWQKCDDFYTYNYKNIKEGISIQVIFIAKNNYSTLSINEIKI